MIHLEDGDMDFRSPTSLYRVSRSKTHSGGTAIRIKKYDPVELSIVDFLGMKVMRMWQNFKDYWTNLAPPIPYPTGSQGESLPVSDNQRFSIGPLQGRPPKKSLLALPAPAQVPQKPADVQ